MDRRTLLALAGLGLTGCAVDDPRVTGTPQPVFTPDPPNPLAGADHLSGLEAAAAALLAAMATAPWAQADAARYQALSQIHHVHRAILASPDPLRRQPVSVAAVAVSAPDSRDAAVAEATDTLTTLYDAHATLAGQTTGQLAAFWGSQAASAVQTRTALTGVLGDVIAAVPLREVATTTPQAASDALLDRYHEAAYGLDSVLGRLSGSNPSRAALSTILTSVKTRRDEIVARTRAASATPVPGAGAYSVPATGSDAEALALASRLLVAIAEAAAVAVTSATSAVATPVADLVAASTLGLPLGYGVAEYPGWPDS